MNESETTVASTQGACSLHEVGRLREKPQLGVKPRWLVAEERLHDLVDAMTRYRNGQYITPPEWFEEAAEIARWLQARKQPTGKLSDAGGKP